MKVLVLLDDICATGTQFTDFGESTLSINEILAQDKNLKIIYLTATAHEEGLALIQRKFPQLYCVAGEILTESNNFFSTENFKQYGVSGMEKEVKLEYEKLVTTVGLPGKTHKLAEFARLGLCYGFSHATPNNTLPVFWCETKKWPALLYR